MDAPTSVLELRRLRTELTEKQLADFKAVVEGRSLPGRRTESALTRNESREWWWRLNDGSGQRPSDIHRSAALLAGILLTERV
jgi:hypothetical protein